MLVNGFGARRGVMDFSPMMGVVTASSQLELRIQLPHVPTVPTVMMVCLSASLG